MKKSTIIILILIIAGVLFLMFRSKTVAPVTETGTNEEAIGDTEITTINEDINSIDIGNTDEEFKAIDADLKAL